MDSFVLNVRVYLEDTDAQGIVYNASYFRFMERSRTEWLRSHGIDHTTLRATHGIHLVLTHVEADLKAAARLGDMLQVEAIASGARGARVVFNHRVLRTAGEGTPGELVCRGVAEVGCVDAQRGRPRRLPAELLDLIKADVSV